MTSKYILSDADIVRKISSMQYRHQRYPLLLIALGFLCNMSFHSVPYIMYLSISLSVMGVLWFVYTLNNFRIRNKIIAPIPQSIYSPVSGTVRFVRSNSDVSLINIRKSFMDFVEIRSPHDDCFWEEDVLRLNHKLGSVTFRFSEKGFKKFDVEEMKAGSVIGIIIGFGSCNITLPSKLELKLSAGKSVDAGETLLYTEGLDPIPRMNV